MSFRKFVNIFCCLLSCSVFLGCEENPVEPNNSKHEIFPLTVGNYWTYLVSGSVGTPDTTVIRIIRQVPVTYGGETFLASARTFYPKGSERPDHEWLFWNGPDGLYLMGGISPSDTFLTKALELKFPGTVGDSWHVPDLRYSLSENRFYISDTLLYSLVGKDKDLQTPAGKGPISSSL